MIKHVNELEFEGDTPWVKAMNLASDYFVKMTDENLSKEEKENAYESWCQIRYEIESGVHGNNS